MPEFARASAPLDKSLPLPPLVRWNDGMTALQRLTKSRLTFLEKFATLAGDIGRDRILFREIILVNEPTLAGEMLLDRSDDFHKGPALSIYSRPLLGNGLLTSEGDFHRRQRRLSAPAFAHKRIATYAAPMADRAERLQSRWHDGEKLDIAHQMMRLTLGIVGKVLFNEEQIEDEADELGAALTVALNFWSDIVAAPIRPPFAFVPPWRRDVVRAIRRLDATIYGLISARQTSGEDSGDLLSMLLLARDDETGAAMDAKQLRDETMTIFLAGHETTAVALSWTIYLLCRHSDVYERVLAECDAVFQNRDAPPTFDDLPKLPFLLCVVKEAMRLYPPAFAIVREAVRDTRIGGFHIPKNSVVLTSAYTMHRRADLFPDPLAFRPDRFANEAERGWPKHAYMPFGGGPRICVGAAFALMEAQIILATLSRHVRFALQDPQTVVEGDPLITLRPRGGVPVVVTRRRQ